MTKSTQLAKYVLHRLDKPISGKRLQKLVYYCQAWHVTAFDARLVEDDAEAWDYGPVYQRVWSWTRYVWPLSKIHLARVEDPAFGRDQTDLIDAVLRYYDSFNDADLIAMSHADDPWRKAYQPGKNCTITITSMRNFYAHVVASGQAAPSLPLMPHSYADSVDFDAFERELEGDEPDDLFVDRLRRIKTGA